MLLDIGGQKTLVIDTPGFDDTRRPADEILGEISRTLTFQYESGMRLRGVIYLHRISDIRYTGSAIRTFEIFRQVCGDDALKNVLLVTNRWHEVDPVVGAQREHQLRDKFWNYMLNRGSNMARFHGTRDSAIALVSQLLSKDPVVLALQDEISNQGKLLNETVVGAYVSDDITERQKQFEKEVETLNRHKDELDRMKADLDERQDVLDDLEDKRFKIRAAEEQKARLHQDVAHDVRTTAQKQKIGWRETLSFVTVVAQLMGAIIGFS